MPKVWYPPTWNVYAAVHLPNVAKTAAPSFFSLAQLRHAQLSEFMPTIAGASQTSNLQYTYILFPKGTDIRRPTAPATNANDWLPATRIRLPWNQDRWYRVDSFEDRAAGFSNEHRACLVTRMPPDTIPMPPIFSGTPIIEPLSVSCGSVTTAARRYRITVVGITGNCIGGLGSCSKMDGSYIVAYNAGCTWGPITLPACNGTGFDQCSLVYDGAALVWRVTFAGGLYELLPASFQPFGSNTFNRVANGAPCSYPLTALVEAAP